MIQVGIRDLKARLSEYLEKAKSGNEIIVTDHGKPIARLIQEPTSDSSIQSKIYKLAQTGSIELPTSDRSIKSKLPLEMKSRKSAADILLNDR